MRLRVEAEGVGLELGLGGFSRISRFSDVGVEDSCLEVQVTKQGSIYQGLGGLGLGGIRFRGLE